MTDDHNHEDQYGTLVKKHDQEWLAHQTPDDLMLAEQVLTRLDDHYRWMRSFWYRYSGGVWIPEEDIHPYIEKTLIDNRKRGVKVTKSKFSSVEFFVQQRVKVRDHRSIDNIGNYLSFKNGMLNLDTMKLEQHRKDALLTTQLDFDYDPKAQCPVFEEFIEQSLCFPDGLMDWKMVQVMQEVMGYTLSAQRDRRISVWLLGESSTGKSTLINALVSILKPLQITIDLNQLGSNNYLLAELPGKRLVTCTEIEVGLRLNVGAYKMLVSSDEIVADIKYRDPIRFVPMCVVWWAMNHTPTISDRTEATFNRVLMFPFNRVVPKDQRDYTLHDKLIAERSGIINWALAGYSRFREQGHFTECEQMKSKVNEFREELDIYRAFIADRDYVLPQGEVSPLMLYRIFTFWCEQRGIKSIPSMPQIAKEWRRCGLKDVRSTNGRRWIGVSIHPTYAKGG